MKSTMLPELTNNPETIVESEDYSDSGAAPTSRGLWLLRVCYMAGNLDCVLEILSLASDRTLAESVLMMLPKAWQKDATLPDHERAFYEYHSCVMEPWDGPAMVAFTDGRVMGAVSHSHCLLPLC